MGYRNLYRRGGIFWWRRKVRVRGIDVPVALSLRTGIFNEARGIVDRLNVSLETLRMAYGEQGTAVNAATLKKIFNDAMRWQLDRIRSDQIGSGRQTNEHAITNMAYGEWWRMLALDGDAARWTADREGQLTEAGWPPEARIMVADLWEERRGEPQVSRRQIEAYLEKFGIVENRSNLERIKRVIYGARAAACDQATRELGSDNADYSAWIHEALADTTPFAFEGVPAAAPSASPAPTPSQSPAAPRVEDVRPKLLLTAASESCITANEKASAWSPDPIEQVRTAIRLFDYACGQNVAIEDLEQRHVRALLDLFEQLPNRWGKTKAEMVGGLSASLAYGKEIVKKDGNAKRLGFSQPTINKHLTWISAVLDHADDDGAITGHRPTVPLKFKSARSTPGSKAEAKKKRSRDKRANWNRTEIEQLLSAPIWHGCAGLDDRFKPGTEIFHDAWYWLPLMLILYGGRSSELVALPMSDVDENDVIPYFQVDYSDLRALKNAQSIRRLPIHPQLIRLGFLEYVRAIRSAEHKLLFPEMHSPKSRSFASTFYKSVFRAWRSWAFPEGTEWRHQVRGAIKDKDVHSFRGLASSLMKGKVLDSIRFDIIGHEGENTTQAVYDEEAELRDKLGALRHLSPLTAHLKRKDLRMRPAERQKFGNSRTRM